MSSANELTDLTSGPWDTANGKSFPRDHTTTPQKRPTLTRFLDSFRDNEESCTLQFTGLRCRKPVHFNEIHNLIDHNMERLHQGLDLGSGSQ